MPKTVMQTVVQQLKREQDRLQRELHGISAALTAFGRVYLGGAKPAKRRTISAAGRKEDSSSATRQVGEVESEAEELSRPA